MIDVTKNASKQSAAVASKPLSYSEVVDYLDRHASAERTEKTLERARQLDQAVGTPSLKLSTIFIAGTNGKSMTAQYTAKLLAAEGLSVGVLSAPHVLTYNERISINTETISNKAFTEIANEIIAQSELQKIQATSHEILTIMALRYFVDSKVDVAILEVDRGGMYNAVNVCNAKVAVVTRVTATDAQMAETDLPLLARNIMGIVKRGTHVISGDQSKNNLQFMQALTQELGGVWVMPIRKLAALPYPYEQLLGRCGALAERAAHMYLDRVAHGTPLADASLLIKKQAQRGRPTLEAKRQQELHPKKTIDQFWREQTHESVHSFNLLDKEKPSILLDTANNLDAFKNVLLGIRLLHYQRPLKGLAIVMGAAHDTLHNEEFLKLVRYFFKKTSGQLFLCPISQPVAGIGEDRSWNTEQVAHEVRTMKVKARACANFEEAFDLAKKSVDERSGLVVITGSRSIVSEYWRAKGLRKF